MDLLITHILLLLLLKISFSLFYQFILFVLLSQGVIESSGTGFQKLCRTVSASVSYTEKLGDWLKDTIQAIDRNDLSSSITKRR